MIYFWCRFLPKWHKHTLDSVIPCDEQPILKAYLSTWNQIYNKKYQEIRDELQCLFKETLNDIKISIVGEQKITENNVINDNDWLIIGDDDDWYFSDRLKYHLNSSACSKAEVVTWVTCCLNFYRIPNCYLHYGEPIFIHYAVKGKYYNLSKFFTKEEIWWNIWDHTKIKNWVENNKKPITFISECLSVYVKHPLAMSIVHPKNPRRWDGTYSDLKQIIPKHGLPLPPEANWANAFYKRLVDIYSNVGLKS